MDRAREKERESQRETERGAVTPLAPCDQHAGEYMYWAVKMPSHRGTSNSSHY